MEFKKSCLPYVAAWLTAGLLVAGVWLFTVQLVDREAQELSHLAGYLMPEGQVLLTQHAVDSQKNSWAQAMWLTLFLLATASLYSWHRWRERRFAALLAQSQERLSRAIDSSGLALWDWDLVTGKFVGDERMLSMLGCPTDDVEVNNDWLLERLHPDDWGQLKASLRSVLKGHSERLVVEHRLRHKDGHWIWVLGRAKVAERDARGRVTRMAGSDVDISERKQLALAARESQELLQNLTDQVPAELFQFRVYPDGRSCFPYVSRHFLDFYGLTLAQVQSDASLVFAWQHPDDADMIKQSVAKMVQELQPWRLEYRLRLPDGSVCWRSGHAQPQRQEDGSVVCYGAIFDITERKLTEESIRIAAVGFESSGPMVVSDARQMIVRVNSAFQALTGYTQEETLGKHASLLKSGRHDKPFYAAMWDSIGQTGHWEGEIWNRRKNGELYPDWLSITVVKNDLGELTHYVSRHSDITLRKRTEDEIRQLAFYDPLTHLPNRRLLLDRLQQLCAASARNDQIGAVLFIDLDHFKRLNDTQGHDQGDVLLEQVARRLQACVREVDTVARLGGDEFVVTLAHLGQDEVSARKRALGVTRKILESLAQPFDLPNLSWSLSASIGLAMVTHPRQLPEDILKNADQAMYAAKQAGRNAFRVFDGLETPDGSLVDNGRLSN